MEMSIKRLFELRPALMVLANAKFKKNGRLTWNLSKLVRKVEAEIGDFESEKQKILKSTHAEVDEKGEFVMDNGNIKLKDKPVFDAAINDMAGEKVEIPFIPVSVDLLDEALEVPLSPAVFADLHEFFIDPSLEVPENHGLKVVK